MHNELSLSQLQVTSYKLQFTSCKLCQNANSLSLFLSSSGRIKNTQANAEIVGTYIFTSLATPLPSFSSTLSLSVLPTCAFKFDKITYTPGFHCCYSHTRTTVQNECAENLHKMLSERVPVPVCVCVRVCVRALRFWFDTKLCQLVKIVMLCMLVFQLLDQRCARQHSSSTAATKKRMQYYQPMALKPSAQPAPIPALPFSLFPSTLHSLPPSAFFVCLQHKSYCTHRQVEQTDGRGV